MHFIPRACGQQKNTSTQDHEDSPLEQTDVAAELLATQQKPDVAVYIHCFHFHMVTIDDVLSSKYSLKPNGCLFSLTFAVDIFLFILIVFFA